MAESAAKPRRRGPGKPFPPGVSGSPGGGRTGSRPRALLRLDDMAEQDATDILKDLLKRAKAGDHDAAVAVLSRIWPPRRGRPIALSGITPKTPAARAMDVILAGMANGTLTPEEAETAARVVKLRMEAVEVADLKRELDALRAREPG